MNPYGITPKMIGIALVVLAFVGVGVYGNVMRYQRDNARLETGKLQQVIEGYRLAAKSQVNALDAAKAEADAMRTSTRELIHSLGYAPKTDQEALQWAIQAAGRIQ